MKRRGIKQPQGGKPVLTASAFLGKDGQNAYVVGEQLLKFIDEARTEDVQEMEAFFDLVKEQLKIVVPRRSRVDRGGMPYKYPSFLRPNSPDGAKVVLIGNINQFMTDYASGLFVTNFTLEDLVSEAEKV